MHKLLRDMKRNSIIWPGSYSACIILEALYRAKKGERRQLGRREIGAIKEIVGLLRAGLEGYKALHKVKRWAPSQVLAAYLLIKEEISCSQGIAEREISVIANKAEAFSDLLSDLLEVEQKRGAINIKWSDELKPVEDLIKHWAFRGETERYEKFCAGGD